MSGVRLVSVCVAVAAISIWGGTAFSQWQENQNRRELAAADVAPGSKVAEAEGKSALEQADELAMAATREFSKLTEGLSEGLSELSIEMPSVAKANAKTPEVEPDALPVTEGRIALPLMKNAPQGEIEVARLEPPVKGAVADASMAAEETALKKAERHEETTADMKEAVETLAAITGEDKDAAKTRITELTAKSLVQSAKETPTLNIARWTVPTGADPVYDESKAIRVGVRPWSVPDAADPSYPKVGEKIAEMAEGVGDKAADATSSMGNSLTSLATGVKSIVTTKRWTVPDANDPDYISQERLADNEGRWQVPTGVQPIYELKDQVRLTASHDAGNELVHHGRSDKLAFVFEDKEKNQRKLAYYSDPVEETGELNITDKIEARLSDVGEAIETALAVEEPVIIKDTSRLPKDRVAVPVDKYASLEVDDGRPVYTKGRVIAVAQLSGEEAVKTEAKLSDADTAVRVTAETDVEAVADKTDQVVKSETSAETVVVADKPEGAEDGAAITEKVAEKAPAADSKAQTESVIAADEATGALIKEAKKLTAVVADKESSAKVAASEKADNQGDAEKMAKPAVDAKAGDFKLAEGSDAEKSDVPEAEVAETATDNKSREGEHSAKAPQKVAEAKKPIWQVPDGADPDYAVVAKIERGLDQVKDAALLAGNGIAETVGKLHSNMKEAVAAEKPWEVPTGVTWGEKDGDVPQPAKEIAVAKADIPAEKIVKTAAAEKPRVVEAAPDAEKPAALKVAEKSNKVPAAPVEVAALTKAENSGETLSTSKALDKEDAKAKIFVSSKLQPVGVAPDMKGANKGTRVTALVQSSAEKKETVVSSVKHMIASLRDQLTGKETLQAVKGDVSRIEEVRFAAMKSLMVDQIDYELINAKEGKGRLRVAGRSQPEAKLAIYIDVDYIGDVVTDADGSWSLSKDIYLAQGAHLVRAEQMSDGGLMLVRKSVQFAQTKSLKKPAGYKADTVGIGLGDKALAVMRDKLKQEQSGISPLVQNANQIPVGDTVGKISDVGTVVDLPLPVRKVELKKAEDRLTDDAGEKPVEDKSAAIVTEDEKSSSVTATEKAGKDQVAETDDQAAVAETDGAENVAASETDAKTGNDEKAVPQVTVYEVKPGDTLAKIAQTVYGDAKRYTELLKLNPELKSANLIYPKQKLKVRAVDTVAEATLVEPVQVAALDDSVLPIRKLQEPIAKAEPAVVDEKTDEKAEAAAIKEQDAEPVQEEANAEFYTVKSGDNLWKIAKQVYGDGERYKEIIELNPVLKNNPGIIKPKVKLRVKAA